MNMPVILQTVARLHSGTVIVNWTLDYANRHN
jgi:hypothetical protein